MRRFVRMMGSLGYEVIPYWGTGHGDDAGYNGESRPWVEMAERIIPDIAQKADPGDYLCLAAGYAQKSIAEQLPDLVPIEYGVGYGGVYAPFLAFESSAWMHCVYGGRSKDVHAANGNFNHTVIPMSFYPKDFPRGLRGAGGGNYLLYIGRIVARKGVQIAIEVSNATGIPLKVAGNGDLSLLDGGRHVDYLGVVGPKARAALMGNAIATLVPTVYIEPFGAVVVESQLTGTPVLSTDFGAFRETVVNGLNGFRCSTVDEFIAGISACGKLNRDRIRKHAINNYSCETVKYQYQRYFERVERIAVTARAIAAGKA
jgi:glycosyltransferase involved in cell wall biosynthesis